MTRVTKVTKVTRVTKVTKVTRVTRVTRVTKVTRLIKAFDLTNVAKKTCVVIRCGIKSQNVTNIGCPLHLRR